MNIHHSISRRNFLKFLGVAVPTLPMLSQIRTQSGSLPNIVWLIADDAGWNDFGCYGHPTIRTPNVDELAQEGLRFENAFVTTPQCSPSRACFWTGKYAHSMRVEDLHEPLPVTETILPEMLQSLGYHTGNVGKLHLGNASRRKFDYVHRDVKAWQNFMGNRPQNRPFFLAVGFHDPHRPYPADTTENVYRKDEVVVPAYLPDTEQVRLDLSLYYSEITRMDRHIGEIVETLRSQGVGEETLILFWSDNGLPFPRAKGTLYDPGIGTPLIMRWPEILEPGIRTGLASAIDIVPTMLDLLDIDIPSDIQGQSMLTQMTDAEAAGRQYIFAERNWHDIDDHIRAVRTSRYKYIRNYYPREPFGFTADIIRSRSYQSMRRLRNAGQLTREQMLIFRYPRPEEELFDLEKDPNEFDNMAYNPAYEPVLNELRGTLDDWITWSNDVSPEKRKQNKYNFETRDSL